MTKAKKNATKKLNAINAALADGMTIMITTYTKTTKVTPKTAKSWADQGLTLFKATDHGLIMASGKNFVNIDFCKITAH